MNIEEKGWEGVDWIPLAQGKDQWREGLYSMESIQTIIVLNITLQRCEGTTPCIVGTVLNGVRFDIIYTRDLRF